MSRFTTSRALAFGAWLFLLAVHATNAQKEAEWTWKSHGQRHTQTELKEILANHRQWLLSEGESGVRADLSDAFLVLTTPTHTGLITAHEARMLMWHLDDMQGIHLDNAMLIHGDLARAYLLDAHLSGARLDDSDLSSAHLDRADLSDASLNRTKLTGAELIDSNLTRAEFYGVDLDGTVFEPKTLPELRGIATAQNLELVTYKDNPDALVQLRKQFQDGGFREQERKITYAPKRREAKLSRGGCISRELPEDKTRAILWSSDSNLANCGSFILNQVFFDWTCQYGMSPGRPLSLGVLLWLLCSLLYFTSIRTRGEAGLYRVYAQSIQDDPSGQRRVEQITPPALTQTRGVRRLLEFLMREWAVLRASMFFSLMSAFNIGFRDINFGRWLRLLTRWEFDMKAVGWARVVAGWQSLISVYFIALWVLTYFGRPFG